MARVWREIAKNKRTHATDSGVDYLCGIAIDLFTDKQLPKKPKANICKNCLRVINKKK